MTTKKQITIQKSKKQIGQNKNKATLFQSLNSQKLTATLVSTCYKKEQSTPILWASTRSDYNGFVIRKKSDSLPLQTSFAVKLSQPASLIKSFQPSSAIKLHRKQDIQKNKLKPPLNNNQNHVASNNNQNQVASNKNQNQVASNNIQNQVASNVKLTDSFSNYFDSSRVNIFADRKEYLNHNSAFTKDCSNSDFMISSKKYDTSRSSKDLKSDQDIPNHSCPKCCTLMWKKENEPYIMVPCGHSICLSCLSEQNHCVICNCQIIGSEQNKILLSVINKFQSFKIKLKLEEKEKEARYYIAQFQSIDKEIKVVQDENCIIINNIAIVEADLSKIKDDIQVIEEKRFYLKSKIQSLTFELKNLESDHASKTDQQTGLEHECSTLKIKFTTIKESLVKLKNTRDKLEFLVEGLCPNLRLK